MSFATLRNGWKYTAVLVLAGLCGAGALLPWADSAEFGDRYCLNEASTQLVQASPSLLRTALNTGAARKAVLLTIDDGPRDAAIDGLILDVLQRHSAKAIWFVNCRTFDPQSPAGTEANRQTLQRIRSSGSMIGNHSYNHINLQLLEQIDHPDVVQQIEQCSAAIGEVAGQRPIYFRPPWGDAPPAVVRAAADAGMRTMRWNVSFDRLFDFRWPTSAAPRPSDASDLESLVDLVQDGDIVLMHDNAPTAGRIDAFLTRLERRGFSFVLPASRCGASGTQS